MVNPGELEDVYPVLEIAVNTVRNRKSSLAMSAYPVRLLLRLIAATILLCLAAGSVIAEPVNSVDSTAAREPEKPRKSLGEVLLGLPGLILSTPIYVTEFLASTVVHVIESGGDGPNILRAFVDPDLPVAPILSYGGRPGLIGGLRFQRRSILDSLDRFRIKATYSYYDYSVFDVKYENRSIRRGAFGLTATASYQRSPRESFYGLGNSSREEQEVAFTLEEIRWRTELAWKPVPALALGGFASWHKAGLFDGHNPEYPGSLSFIRTRFGLVPDQMRPSSYLSTGALLDFDYRNHEGRPTAGGRVLAEFSVNDGLGTRDDIMFTRTRVEVQQFVDVWEKRVLAFRAIVQDIDGRHSEAPVPIYLLNSLGGTHTLRSYHSARFVDRDLVLATVEYRYPVWDVLDAFLFLDKARVFNRLDTDFTWRDWHHSAGCGLRLWTEEDVVGMVTLATGREGTRFFFQLGQVF